MKSGFSLALRVLRKARGMATQAKASKHKSGDPDSCEGRKLTPQGHPLTSVHTLLLHTSCVHTTNNKIKLYFKSLPT